MRNPYIEGIYIITGGKINESVYYLSEKDYGVLTGHIKHLNGRFIKSIKKEQRIKEIRR